MIKNIFKFLAIVLIIACLVVGLLVGIMFVFPSVELFGFRYVANHKEYGLKMTESEFSNITKINVETNNYDVVIVPNSNKDIASNNVLRIVISNNYTGFANKNNKGVMLLNTKTNEMVNVTTFENNLIDSNLIKNGTEFTIKLGEPSGVVSYNNSKVLIAMPENASGVEYNIVTNKGKINFAQSSENKSRNLLTSNITIKVNSAFGSFNIDNAKMSNDSTLNIENYLGKVDINSDKIANVNINSNSGNFTFKNIGFDGYNANLTVKGNNPYVTVNKIYGSVNFNTTTGYLKCTELLGDGIIETKNGIVRIDKALNGISVKNESGETTIKQLGEDGASTKSAEFESVKGAINLGTEGAGVYYLSRIKTTSGKVNIKNLYYNGAVIESTSGKVDVEFAKNGVQKDLTVTSNQGAITLTNVYGNITAKTTKSKIKASFVSMSSLSTFETDNGEVELVLPTPTDSELEKYNLDLKNKNNTTNKSNKLTIKLASFTQTKFEGNKDTDGYYTFTRSFPESSTTTNTISVKTNSGRINIHE